jgi:hypothetical protein
MTMTAWIEGLPWDLLIIACLTLGLAPFFPQPHVVEKLRMLFTGKLSKPIDIFDLVMHGTPWVLLLARGVLWAAKR